MKKFLFLFTFLFGFAAINAQTYFDENFDDGIPADWTQVTNATDGGWLAGDAAALTSPAYPIADNGTGQMIGSNDDACNCDKSSDRIITPMIDLSTASSDVVLKFNSHYQSLTYQGATEHCYLEVSTDAGATWTVLQELPIQDGWANNVFVSLADYAGIGEVWISFHYTDSDGWTYGVAVDEILVYEPQANDIKVNSFTTSRFHESGEMVEIATDFTNLGADNLTSFDYSWSDGTNSYTETISGLDVPFGEVFSVNHPTMFNVADAISYNMSIEATNPNGVVDINDGDNTATGVISGVSYIPTKKMYVEEATGTWCGWCPRGWEWMDWMSENYPDDFIGVAVHNNDPMAVAEFDAGTTSVPGFPGFPSVVIDRSIVDDPSNLENAMPASLSAIAPVAPEVTTAIMTVEDMNINIEANAEFVTQLDNIDYRMNLILSESLVTGTGSLWNQVNYYSGGNPDPIPNFGIDWNAASDPVDASLLEYNHVGRWLSDGYEGSMGSVPTSVVAGDIANHSFNGDFNAEWNPFNMHAIAIVTDNESGKVLNANSIHVEVVCPADIAQTIEVNSTTEGLMEGSINVTLADPSLGFGGYTFSLNTGESSDVGTPIEGLAAGTYTITVMDAIGCAVEFEETIQSMVSVQDIETLTSVSLFPNPAVETSLLSATFDQLVDLRITLVNTVGQVVDQAQFDQVNEVSHEINVADLPAGLYLVKMNVNDQVRTQRLMVK